MCNLYRIGASQDDIAAYFKASVGPPRTISLEKDYVAPAKPGLVVREEAGARLIDTMAWGFPFQGKPVTNVRNYTSPFWRSALQEPARRCLVPVTAFQEWSVAPDPETGKKRPHWFSLPAQPIFAFAGIWRPSASSSEAVGGEVRAPFFSFLTCGYDGDPSAHLVGAIHPKAIPVILHEEDYGRWLDADLDDALQLATAFPSQLMVAR